MKRPGFKSKRPAADSTLDGIRGIKQPGLEPLDEMMVSFVQKHRVPGAALAATRNGCLIYARSFGFADVDQCEPVEPESLFRLASVSKPITGAAILQLAERKQLSLNDKIIELLNIKPEPASGMDKRWNKITVLDLLHHRGGWDCYVSPYGDPMFQLSEIADFLNVPSPARAVDVVRYMLRQPLEFDPGTKFAYSNFGYCVLGRIIEAVTGQSYEAYVCKEVLAPLDICNMKLGRTLLQNRAPGEVVYYDELQRTGTAILGPDTGNPVPSPYGVWCIEAMDAHGGWIGSAVDLMRFASAFDHPSACKILNAESVSTMFARPATDQLAEVWYGCGWNVRTADASINAWHMGGLDGTSTLLVRRFDGLNWAVLFNARNGIDGIDLAVVIDALVHQAMERVEKFPDVNLFNG